MLHAASRRTFLKSLALLACTPLFGAGCSRAAALPGERGGRILVAYFSLPETDRPDSMTREEANSTVVVNGQVLGNTQYAAELIRDMTGGDLFRIEPKVPYTTNHKALVDQAYAEQQANARPELAKKVSNIGKYDIVFVGCPNWWADMPMIMYTFFEQHDLAGKTVIPFVTHGGSGFSDIIRTIAALEPKATVVERGFKLSRNSMEEAPERISAWLSALGFIR
ncbi:MAG: flavodoxin [Desulfovibrionaceae bacterium]|nr:flavodoxin [Desulfovibrionaceae bacterium]